jgi:hypothetical protein
MRRGRRQGGRRWPWPRGARLTGFVGGRCCSVRRLRGRMPRSDDRSGSENLNRVVLARHLPQPPAPLLARTLEPGGDPIARVSRQRSVEPSMWDKGHRARQAPGCGISRFLSHNRKLPELLIILRSPALPRARTLPGRASKPSFRMPGGQAPRESLRDSDALRHRSLFAFVGESPWIAVCPIRSFSRVSPHSSF